MRKKNKRTFTRLFVPHLVKYKPLSDTKDISEFELTTIKDIGAGGVCLRTQEYLPVSSLIELKINFPSLKVPVFTVAKVTWIKQRHKGTYYDVGLQFVRLEESVRKIIDEHIKSVHHRARKAAFQFFAEGRKKDG